MNEIQNFIFRSVIEDKALASIFLVNIKKEFITQDFQVVYEEIQKAYNEDMPFSVLYFSRVVPENLMLQILMHTPSKDIQPFFRFLKQDYVIRMQTQISDKLLECSKNNRIADFQSLLNEFDYNSDKEYRTMKQWYDYFQSNNINIKKFELGIPFLDVALHGGIELGQLVLITNKEKQLDTGKASLIFQILENLSKDSKTLLAALRCCSFKNLQTHIHKINSHEHDKDSLEQNMLIMSPNDNYSLYKHNDFDRIIDAIQSLQDLRFVGIDSLNITYQNCKILSELAKKKNITIFLTAIPDNQINKKMECADIVLCLEHNLESGKICNNSRILNIKKNRQTHHHSKTIIDSKYQTPHTLHALETKNL